jgi:integrase
MADRSEALPQEWRQEDLRAGEVRADAGTTKNREGRVVPLADDLRRLLETRLEERGSRTEREPRPIVAFSKAWKTAWMTRSNLQIRAPRGHALL